MSDDCANTVNCTGNDNEVHVCAVKELIGKQFVIPSYQRGYRWGDTQVQQLFDDLKKAYVEGWPSYNLQPLVVTLESNGVWCVIDGQQRLTSLYLLLKVLKLKKEKLWTLSYDTRSDSKDFLENIGKKSQDKADKNPDYYHMYAAWKLFDKLFGDTWPQWTNSEDGNESESPEQPNPFFDYILKKAQFIWYPAKDVSEAAKDVFEAALFKRLNSGKIALSNAELSKALFFDYLGETFIEDWNMMEHTLRKEDFWAFVNPEPKAARFEATRLDFLFELWMRLTLKTESENKQESGNKHFAVKELDNNPFMVYKEVEKRVGKESKDSEQAKARRGREIWESVKEIFRYLEEFYENRETYHLLGFLMRNRESADKRFETLCNVLKKAFSIAKHDEVEEMLRRKCEEVVQRKDEKGNVAKDVFGLGQMNYEDSNERDRIHNILLLFNLALMERETIERARFPFDLMLKATWSLEHIHAQNESIENKDEDSPDYGVSVETADRVAIKERKDGTRYYECEGFDLHGIGNMALLDTRGNSAFNSGTYLMKRKILSDWMHGKGVEKAPEFIPIGTWLVFGGLFTKDTSASFVWTTKDAETYESIIGETVSHFLGITIK